VEPDQSIPAPLIELQAVAARLGPAAVRDRPARAATHFIGVPAKPTAGAITSEAARIAKSAASMRKSSNRTQVFKSNCQITKTALTATAMQKRMIRPAFCSVEQQTMMAAHGRDL
jgi:hypothetical protein